MISCIVLSEPTHVILDGPPASGKTIFYPCKKNLTTLTLLTVNCNRPWYGRVFVTDEVEKMSKRDQKVLLNLIETGVLTSSKSQENI